MKINGNWDSVLREERLGMNAYMHVALMTDNTDNQITLRGTGNRNLIAILVLLAVFTLGNTIHLLLMQRIDLVLVFGLLIERALIKQKIFLVAFKQAVFGQRSSQFPDQDACNGSQALQRAPGLLT